MMRGSYYDEHPAVTNLFHRRMQEHESRNVWSTCLFNGLKGTIRQRIPCTESSFTQECPNIEKYSKHSRSSKNEPIERSSTHPAHSPVLLLLLLKKWIVASLSNHLLLLGWRLWKHALRESRKPSACTSRTRVAKRRCLRHARKLRLLPKG